MNTLKALALRNVNTWMAGDGDDARLRPMLEVPVAAACAMQIPAVLLDKLDRFPDLHAPMPSRENVASTLPRGLPFIGAEAILGWR